MKNKKNANSSRKAPPRGFTAGLSDNLKEWRQYLSQERREAHQRNRETLEELRHDMRLSSHAAHRFPESEFVLAQLVLFAVGNFPRFLSVREMRFFARHRRQVQNASQFRALAEKVRLHPVVFLGSALAIAAVAAFLSLYTLGTSVTCNGFDLGTVGGNLQTVNRIVAEVQARTREVLQDDTYTVDPEAVQQRTHIVSRRVLESTDDFEEKLTHQLGAITNAYMLYVDGEPIAATTYSGAIEELLAQLKLGYTSANTAESYFVESVEIRQEYVNNRYLKNLGYIAEIVNETKAGEVTYTVQWGDAPLSIAADCGVTYDELKAMNPGYDWSVLRVGDVLTISNAVPYLTVVNVERQSYVENIPYTIEYTEDNAMYQGDYKVLSPGEFGKADITANVTLINGEETARQVVASVTLKQPITEHQATGTIPRPSWFPTGSFRWPCNGYISSYFGYRNTGIRGASTYHQAIDIANSWGTPIYASDGGTVVTAGWVSGLGYTVKIDHGNGYVTSYGHNSSLCTYVGAHVYKGELIAKMGSTGVSSGSHCDFRICLNGTYVNPLNYLH